MKLTEIDNREQELSYGQFARPFTPLHEEIRRGFQLVAPRFGRSPRLAFVKVNEACQLNCAYCNANKVKGPQLPTKKELKILDNLAGAGIQMVNLTGGEPTLRDDLPEIISHSKELGMLTTLSTNGGIHLRDGSYWHNLAEAGLFGADLSYDGVGEKSDPAVIDTAAFLINAQHIYAGVRMVVTADNVDLVYPIGEKCMNLNIFFQAILAEALNGETSAAAGDFHPLDSQGRREYVSAIQDLKRVRGPFARFLRIPDGYLEKAVSLDSPTAWHCTKPSSHWIAVDARGRARICNDMPLSKEYDLTTDENPLLTKQFHQDVDEESRRCAGCTWFCHWESNRPQHERVIDEARFILTVAALT